jgi:hypothetical protein
MKTKLFLVIFGSCFFYLLSSQVPQGFNYQAIARDSDGKLITSSFFIKVEIQNLAADTIFWIEEHNVTPNEFGLVSFVVGQSGRTGGTATNFADIDWVSWPRYLKTSANQGSGYTLMGTTQIWAVPYSLVAKDVEGPIKKLEIGNTDISPDSILFEVINKTGQTIFAVYNEGVRIYVDDGVKGPKGGFTIGGFGTAKTPSQEYLRVTKDSTRVYVNPDPAKGPKGGFAIGGFGTKGLVDNFLNLTKDNYFIGHSSGMGITNGARNSFLGYEAGIKTKTGNENIFIGYQSGMNNVAGHWNTFLGYQAGMTNTGSDNTFIGYKAGNVHESGGGNVYIGSKTGEFATNGQQNIFIGESAGSYTTEGHTNIFIGLKAGYSSEVTWGNIFIGNEAGYNTLGGSGVQGSYNTFIGWQSGKNNVIGSNNTYVGTLSGMSTTSEYNTMIGTESGWKNTDGGHNTFVGYRSGYNSTYAVSTGSNNTFIGDESGFDITTGYSNVFVGGSSGHGNSTGNENTFVGRYAGNGNSTGYRNTFIGLGAGSQNYTGNENVAIGNDAGRGALNNVGNSNVFVGNWSGWSTGSTVSGEAERNTFLGKKSGYSNSTGSGNTYVGNEAGYSNTAGTNNTYVGASAGGDGTTGTGNVFIGYRAGYSESGNDKLYIHNYSGTPLIYGDFASLRVGINTTSPSEVLEVNGNVKAVSFIATTTGAGAYKYNTTVNMNVPDYVFDNHFEGNSAQNPDYEMLSFAELNQFISENRHLPGVPSRAEIEKAGVINLQGISMITLEKVEENTLYILELEKITMEQQIQIEAQSKQIEELKKLIANIMTSISSPYNR